MIPLLVEVILSLNSKPLTIQFQPMKFIKNNTINEDLISQYDKRQFHQTIQQLSFSLHLDEVEYLSLNLQSLTKIKQIQIMLPKYKNHNLLMLLKLKHFEDKNSYYDLVKMNVTEILRLEMVKEDIVKSIVSVLRKKITFWENLCSGDIQNMNRFLDDIIKISLQIEQSRNKVDIILSGFTNQVQKNY
ncbi:unnamed protein product (macronuclear) [Paramecium tetraurelia]|uniref:Uncharacterized protein n=1 Tax=Paramecium tetraurelia TaxID=5888 RepID=A0CIM3_PARTE|nr:uncharacterized protein GSPATT00007775001 [Paramecium tetraurelia]CAK70640.1 unnamed protein product [Paramecium tetraurelia]|eukprot:XP_001438037.1 hypothetical protein (macronuclear) [Paramecium tetraurelia strain d4-2]